MTDFDLIFALLSLLLGLSIAELLSGFARILRLQARQRAAAKGALRVNDADDAPPPVRVGLLVPLLGAFVLLDQLSFFTAAYAYRNAIPANMFWLLAITLVVGGYYVVATLIFPEEPGDWPDFDRYYDEHNRVVLGFALFTQGAQLLMNALVPRAEKGVLDTAPTPPALLAFMLVLVFATFPLLIATYRARNRRTNAVLLGTLVGQRLLIAALSLWLAPKGMA
ncbi:hypothetical protein [Novosphingobium sp. 9U]|uniref:hypothetical protein n=1 Tax=Novosphingobium sp. 9U TaxID=2653158 RepID=UPI0012F1D11B|nr:hypothetical protein [Novosphingobium sp. 9U]VWX51400.1 conserved membrane hypothetical protein [Novosphingobium sp. 9U]